MKRIVISLFFLIVPMMVFSQSNDKISEILESSEISYGQACYISACAQNLIDDDSSYEDAIRVLFDKGQIPAIVGENEPIALANLTYIYAKLWNVKGGLLFRITKGSPRYSFKQFKSDSLIDERYDPTTVVSGWEALNLYTEGSYYYENQSIDAIE
ncbi:MAG: hypothetical protein IKK80_06240 [Treponema sp.]|nr:hypothetical protein [Treponema sp.]